MKCKDSEKFFLPLSVVNNKVVIRVVAALLCVWYSMSIIGFDVHTCSRSGRSFVATFVQGLACEDIHPSHTCSNSHCCAHHDDGCCVPVHDASGMPSFASSDCCSNDYQVICMTGELGQGAMGKMPLPVFAMTCQDIISERVSGPLLSVSSRASWMLRCLGLHLRDACEVFSIWRI